MIGPGFKPPMPAHRYMEENGLAAMLAAKRSAGVAPEENLGKCITHTPLPSMNKEISPEVQNRSFSGPTKKDLCLPKFFEKSFNIIDITLYSLRV